MLWATFNLAFFGLLRVSEFTYSSAKTFLAACDITFIPNIATPTHIRVHIKQSKTDPFRQGTTRVIARSHSSVCAVTALLEYLLPRNPADPEEPLFMLQNKEPLTRTLLNAYLRELLNILGYVETDYANKNSCMVDCARTVMNSTFVRREQSFTQFPKISYRT